MAELYSVDEYTALIWPEHFRSSWGPFEGKNWGTVDEVKAAKQGGKLRLFVKLTGNKYLLDANKDGQKLFMSIEPDPDYKKEGRCYLMGLAVTDTPATTGSSRLKFSIGDVEKNHEYSELEPLSPEDFIAANSVEDSQIMTKAASLFTQLFSLFATGEQETNPNPNPDEEEEMTKEQHETLMQKFSELGNKVGELESKFTQQGEQTPPEETLPEGGKDTGGQTGVTAEQFNSLMEALKGVSKQVTAMETKFNALSQETGEQEPDPVGGSDSVNLV